MVSIVFKQTLAMAIYMAVGYLLYSLGKVSDEGAKSLSNILLFAVAPCLIISSFFVEFTHEKLAQFGISFFMAMVIQLFSLLVGRLVFSKDPQDCLSVAFCNIGYMGIPLISAALGNSAVFYIIGYIVIFNTLQWNYAIPLLKGTKQKFNISSVATNPFVIASAIGFAIFALRLGTKIPYVLKTAISQIGAINGPVAMLLLGIFAAQSGIKNIFSHKSIFLVTLFRLILVPIATIFILKCFPAAKEIKYALTISACAPVAANVAIYTKLYSDQQEHVSFAIAFTTMVSIVTIPGIVYLAELLF